MRGGWGKPHTTFPTFLHLPLDMHRRDYHTQQAWSDAHPTANSCLSPSKPSTHRTVKTLSCTNTVYHNPLLCVSTNLAHHSRPGIILIVLLQFLMALSFGWSNGPVESRAGGKYRIGLPTVLWGKLSNHSGMLLVSQIHIPAPPQFAPHNPLPAPLHHQAEPRTNPNPAPYAWKEK